MVFVALVVPIAWLEKLKLVGETVTAAEPVPLRLTDCGLVTALSVNASEPARAPVVVGAKVTPTAQFAPAAMLVPHVLLEIAKSPVAVMLLKFSAVFRWFVTVTDFALELFPTAMVPKLRDVLDSDTGAMPVPDNETDCGLREELLVTVN
jgi:hypothetical protein